MKPTLTLRSFLLTLLLALSAWPAAAVPQTADGQEEQAPPPADIPDIGNLSVEWWRNLVGKTSPDADGKLTGEYSERLGRFIDSIRTQAQGLDAENLAEAETGLGRLRNLADLLRLADDAQPAPEFEPILTREQYDLGSVLALRAQMRGAQQAQTQLSLELEQAKRQVSILDELRRKTLRQYQAATPESPARLLRGIDRVANRLDHELSRREVSRLEKQLDTVEKRLDSIERQLDFARNNLGPGELDPESVEALVAEASADLGEKERKVAATQRKLLDALSEDPVNSSLVTLRKQQLTRAQADAALARLEAQQAGRISSWFRFRSGQPVKDFDPATSAAEVDESTLAVLEQVGVWSDITRATLITPMTGQGLNAVKNIELARSVARETLTVLSGIREASDDLVLIQEILNNESIASQSGWGRAWANISLTASSAWEHVSRALEFELFSIGDAPVTPGGIVTMLLIVALAWLVSWLLRHLLDRATGRSEFVDSPVAYTLGRLLHYIIIFIGVFAALGSIGMDFTNFALIAGALSVGIGFGLQAIVNNFVSGLILLFEGSLRIGDYIELDSGLAGTVKEINTRATVVNSNDAVDVVVPNSELVTTKLTNWTLRETVGRIRVPFGVAYGSDKEKVREVALKAAEEMDFISLHMRGREPQVRLVNFGDSALEFELLAWVNRQGVRRPHRVRASFLWALETGLTEAGIEIPFPQRDVHIKNPDRQEGDGQYEAPDEISGEDRKEG